MPGPTRSQPAGKRRTSKEWNYASPFPHRTIWSGHGIGLLRPTVLQNSHRHHYTGALPSDDEAQNSSVGSASADLRFGGRNVDGDEFPANDFQKAGSEAKSVVKTACRHCGRRSCGGRHFDAVLVSMLTTSTRRLIGSSG